jgi:hypothetical protein
MFHSKRKEWERGNRIIYVFLLYTLDSYPSPLPLVTLSLYFEKFHSPSH